jgi:hypothetical protein
VVNNVVSAQAFLETALVTSSGAFNPTVKDNDQLSVYNGGKFSAKQAYDHYTRQFTAYGVLSVSVEEVHALPPLTSIEDNNPFDGHCYIDFSGLSSKNQRTKKAGQLRDFAVERGWTHKP